MGQSGDRPISLSFRERGGRGWVMQLFCRLCAVCEIVVPGPAIFTLHLSFTAIDPHEESVEDLMQRFQDSFRAPNTPTEISHYEHVMHSSLTGRRRLPTHTRGEPQRHRRRVADGPPYSVLLVLHLETIQIFYNRSIDRNKRVKL